MSEPPTTESMPALPQSQKRKRGRQPEHGGGNRGNGPISPTNDPINLQPHIQAAARLILGEPIQAVALSTRLSERQTQDLKDICGLTIEDFRERVRLKTQAVLDLLTERMPTIVDQLEPMQTFVAFGITMDKHRDLTGGTVPHVVHNTQINVNGINRAAALATLTSGVQRPILQ